MALWSRAVDSVEELIAKIDALSPRRRAAVEAMVDGFGHAVDVEINPASDFVTTDLAEAFGDVLRGHHLVSSEPFTKDKFEHALQRLLSEVDHVSVLSPRGTPGRDLDVGGERWSLKTQADASIKRNEIHISKFMELGQGRWEVEEDLTALRERMFRHMEGYDRIFTLRCLTQNRALRDGDEHCYELVEIPKSLLLGARHAPCRMEMTSRQMPKPGTCTCVDESGQVMFQLYFDGGTERKLQVRKLAKDACIVHAAWVFKKPA